MTSTHRIEPGQEYESCTPTYYGSAGEEHTRIRVVGHPGVIPNHGEDWGYGKAEVVTLTADGRELRRRAIEAGELHATGTTRDGQPRKSGYYLVRNADGSEA